MPGQLRFVKCPFCGYQFATTATVTARCRNDACLKEFQIRPEVIVGDRPVYTAEDCRFTPAVAYARGKNYRPPAPAPAGDPDIKICPTCSRPLSIWEFDPDPAGAHGLARECKQCRREQKK